MIQLLVDWALAITRIVIVFGFLFIFVQVGLIPSRFRAHYPTRYGRRR